MLNIPTANALQEAASSMVSQGVGELLAQFTAAFKQTNRTPNHFLRQRETTAIVQRVLRQAELG